MIQELKRTSIQGCYELFPVVHSDSRGSFVKTFHREVFATHHLNTVFPEEYYSTSQRGVLRGMHFQRPPHDHTKIVYCVAGRVMDFVVDIRVGSPTYGMYVGFDLNASVANMIYIPSGLAHGFYVVSDQATLIYKVSTVYAPESDSGVLWSSLGISWPTKTPLVSDRDSKFIPLDDFSSPFIFEGACQVER